jgi:hypothetical protein
MQRVLRYDGLLPNVMDDNGQFRETQPQDIQTMKAFVEENRVETTPFDIISEGETPGDDPGKAATIVHEWAEAGATWWIESRWKVPRNEEGLKAVHKRIMQGPPRVE